MTALYAAWITLVASLAIVFITAYVLVAAKPEKPANLVLAAIYSIRFRYFLFLVGALVIVLVATLPLAPYRAPAGVAPDARIEATAHMWYWDLAGGERTELELTADGAIRLPAGALVDFSVTSGDVNHGFGLYDEAGRLLAQTQAMPGYVNRLRFRFERPGTYRILCMEFCGLLHHNMTATLVVGSEAPAAGSPTP